MQTPNEVRDEAKLEAIVASLARDGWQGAPLVVWDEQLLTGPHRYAACQRLEWSDYEIPVIDVHDLFALANLDFDALLEEEGVQDISELPWVLDRLPESIRDEYGIDWH